MTNDLFRPMTTLAIFLVVAPLGNLAIAGDDQGDSGSSVPVLSVAPLDHIEYPSDRPEWLSHAPELNEEDDDRIVVVAGPSDSPDEAAELLSELVVAEIHGYISQVTGLGGNHYFFPIDKDWVNHELISREYKGKLTQGDQGRYEAAVELTFGEHDRKAMIEAKRDHVVGERLGVLGPLMLLGAGLLACGSGVTNLLARRSNKRKA